MEELICEQSAEVKKDFVNVILERLFFLGGRHRRLRKSRAVNAAAPIVEW